ncbi:DMRTB factor, partial [Atractosteus spatula]|nr:DMRTB factor [Atractosteus spatula]
MSTVSKPDNQEDRSAECKAMRTPKCARCRNHGFIVQLKGHTGKCPFYHCSCWKCSLITERTKIMASQRRLKKLQNEEALGNANLTSEKEPLTTTKFSGCWTGVFKSGQEGAGSRPESYLQGEPPVPKVQQLPARTESVIKKSARRQGCESYCTEPAVPFETKRDHLNVPRMAASSSLGGPSQNSDLEAAGDRPPFAQWGAVGRDVKDNAFVIGRNPSHVPKDFALAEVTQGEMGTGQFMNVPIPVKLYTQYPNGYSCQAFLLSMPPAPGPMESHSLHSVQLGFSHFQPNSSVHLPESPQVRRLHFSEQNSDVAVSSPERCSLPPPLHTRTPPTLGPATPIPPWVPPTP